MVFRYRSSVVGKNGAASSTGTRGVAYARVRQRGEQMGRRRSSGAWRQGKREGEGGGRRGHKQAWRRGSARRVHMQERRWGRRSASVHDHVCSQITMKTKKEVEYILTHGIQLTVTNLGFKIHGDFDHNTNTKAIHLLKISLL